MKKFGFTLAEVLVTLGIVGVIAAITLPPLQVNVQRQSAGTALAKAINTLENANRMLLTQENARNLTEVCARANGVNENGDANFEGDNYLTCLVNHRVLIATREADFDDVIRDYSFAVHDNTLNNEKATKYILSDGIILYGWNGVAGVEQLANSRFHPQYYTVFVDTNGPKAPNALARDVFPLDVNATGEILAYGSRAWDEFHTESDVTWEGFCDEDSVENWGSAGNVGVLCAGSVVDNGYRVIYPF